MSGPQPLSYVELHAYVCLKFQMRAEQVARLVRFVEELDDAYLRDYSTKQSKKGNKP